MRASRWPNPFARPWPRCLPAALAVVVMLLGGVRAACPMHAGVPSAERHHHHERPTEAPTPCSCIGDCVLPVVPSLGRAVVLPTSRIILAEAPAALAPLPVRDARPSQLRLPFSTAPPAA